MSDHDLRFGRTASGESTTITRRDVALCFSLANLLTARLWLYLFTMVSPALDYFNKERTPLFSFILALAATLAATFGLTIVFLAILRALRKWGNSVARRIAATLSCALLAIPVYAIAVRAQFPRAVVLSLVAGVLIAASIIAFGGKLGQAVAKWGALAVATLWPQAMVASASLAWMIYTRAPESAFQARPLAPLLPLKPGSPRVVLVVFDELDEELLFKLRPARIKTPTFDRLRAESLYADDAVATSTMTLSAFPTLTTGRRVRTARATSPSTLEITFQDGSSSEWGEGHDIFRSARTQGFNSAIVGWYHPWCRIFNSASACVWERCPDAFTSQRKEFVYAEWLAGPVRLANFAWTAVRGGPSMSRQEYDFLGEYQRQQAGLMLAKSYELVADERYNFVLLHLPVPHLPVITASGKGNYFENLEEADEVLRALRQRLETSGLWDRTTVLVTGDHPLRVEIWGVRPMWTQEEAKLTAARSKRRVPFFLKMPGQETGLHYQHPLDTILIHDLVLDILASRVHDAEGAKQWIQEHSPRKDE